MTPIRMLRSVYHLLGRIANSQFLVRQRVYLLVLLHALVFAFTFRLAFALRFDFEVPEIEQSIFMLTLPGVLALKLLVYYFTGNFHGWLRYVTFSDLIGLFWAATLSVLLIAAVDYFLVAPYQIPRAILVIDWGLTILITGGLRSLWRFSREQFWPMFQGEALHRALLVGADGSGVALVNHIHAHPKLGYRIVGFLDPDPAKQRRRVAGLLVVGLPDEAPDRALALDAKDVLVIAGSLPGKQVRRLMERCEQNGIRLRVIPGIGELLSGRSSFQIRDVNIHDLLRREPVQLDSSAVAGLIQGRTVLVTGAGGSIGGEICRQVLRFAPQSLVLVERAENNLFLIEQELRTRPHSPPIVACIGDILDRRRMAQLFDRYRPDVVFHAAAHKHVPMMEANPGEAIKNNVIGTKRLADIADRFRVQSFVLISTDKAVNPASIMGASKQFAERYVHAFSQVSGTRFVVVRFGNVLGSAGSVVPIFQEQIRRGGPVTVTHPEMERFFMTIPEASQLVLQAAAMGKGGEVFVLDMGEPVKILDVARDLIRLSGLGPDDIEIRFTGPRPGEKFFEELYFDDEQTLPTTHPKLRVAYHRPFSMTEVRQAIGELWRLRDEREEVIRTRLKELIPEFAAAEPDRIPAGLPQVPVPLPSQPEPQEV